MLLNFRPVQSKSATPKVGVALSGGGLRGFAHVGVLEALIQHEIPIDMIAGTSAGSIVAALYACGVSPQQMKDIIKGLKLQDFIDLKITLRDLIKHGFRWLTSGRFKFWSVLPSGLLKGDRIERFLNKHWHDKTMRDVQVPLAITAVDINSADTVFFTTPFARSEYIMNAQYYHNTLISDAVRASISIPGIFFPKKYRGMTLVDGAVKNNLPTDILRYMGADVVIGVDLGYAGDPNYNIETVGEILMQCLDIMGREVTLLKGEKYADIVIRPLTALTRWFNRDHKEQLFDYIEKGKLAALEQMSDIKKLIDSVPIIQSEIHLS